MKELKGLLSVGADILRTMGEPNPSVVRLLCIDDDPDDVALLRRALTPDFLIDHAASIEEGVPRILANEHDVYLIDRKLPGGCGLDIIAKYQGKVCGPLVCWTGAHRSFFKTRPAYPILFKDDVLEKGVLKKELQEVLQSYRQPENRACTQVAKLT